VRFIPTPAEDAGGRHTGSDGRSSDIGPSRRKKMKGAMSNLFGVARSHERWARFRFSVIGPLLAAPPERGELQEQLKGLAAKNWQHPITGQRVQFDLSTIERWFYTARNEKKDPVQALRRKIRSDQGGHPALSSKVRELLRAQYRQHPNWSYQLHVDNLAVLIEKEPTLGAAAPSYASVMRFMKVHGLIKCPRCGPVHSPGAQATEHRIEAREIRSYESEYVNALWHLDFHHGSLRVLLEKGGWVYPLMLGIIDDHSRLCCHAQWYLAEGAEELCHGLSQALQKRALPRALMSDNGSAMLARRDNGGLGTAGYPTRKNSALSFQNGKQEIFWLGIEGRLLPMLEGVADLTLSQLNQATLAWIEMEYNRSVHTELGEAPLQRYLHHRDVGRPCPSSAELKMAFTAERFAPSAGPTAPSA
jgi:putative transposase